MPDARPDILLPVPADAAAISLSPWAGGAACDAVRHYLQACAEYVIGTFTTPSHAARPGAPEASADAVVATLLERDFNYQSKSRVAALLPGVRQRIAASISAGQPLRFFLDYGGGYHATTCPDFSTPLGFDATAAELLLLYQIARLHRRVAYLYSPGFVFHIVLDNGVADYVNDIPIAWTQAYARRLHNLIVHLGASGHVRILLQSSLGDFRARMHGAPVRPADRIEAQAHRNIERFLGRGCTEAEARLRAARYVAAESVWESELRQIVTRANGVRFLQRASAEFLSFRPFPGGATRVQSGQIGFRLDGDKVVPTLVTTNTASQAAVMAFPLDWQQVIGAPAWFAEATRRRAAQGG